MILIAPAKKLTTATMIDPKDGDATSSGTAFLLVIARKSKRDAARYLPFASSVCTKRTRIEVLPQSFPTLSK